MSYKLQVYRNRTHRVCQNNGRKSKRQHLWIASILSNHIHCHRRSRGGDLFFFFWRPPNFGRKKHVRISDFGRKITLNFGEDIRIFEGLCLKSPPPKFSTSATGMGPPQSKILATPMFIVPVFRKSALFSTLICLRKVY